MKEISFPSWSNGTAGYVCTNDAGKIYVNVGSCP